MTTRIEEAVHFKGEVTFSGTTNLPADCVRNKQMADDAETKAEKAEHQHRIPYAQESAAEATAETRVIHVVHGVAGELQSIQAGSVVANLGDATITIDLLKNGVSILTAPFILDSGDAAYALVEGVIDTAAVAAGDVLEIDIAVNGGTGTLGKGVFVSVDLFEDAD